MARLFVIGIGYRPFDARARAAVLASEALFASPRLAEVFRGYAESAEVGDRLVVNGSIEETFSLIRDRLTRGAAAVTLLASGDPLFYGIGKRALSEFGRDDAVVLPDLSCIQVAFSRLGTTWDDALLISLHGGPDPGRRRRLEHTLDDLPSLTQARRKIAILTDAVNNPSVVAATLLGASLEPEPRMFVCERLGYPDERVVTADLRDMAGESFREPNVVVVMRSRHEGGPR